ncbi:hypothetical protein BJX99DRAFT_144034 [Aspergillus californicus]
MSTSYDLGPPPLSFPRQFLKNLLASPPQPPRNLDLTGQTAIITGGYTGLGYQCATALLSYNLSYLIITVRNEKKGGDAAAELGRRHPKAKIDVWLLDMLSYDSIKGFTTQCNGLTRIDFVILNAGTMSGEFMIDKSTKHEVTFQVNYLSTALLTFLLLPVLQRLKQATHGKPSRITLIGSSLAATANFPEHKAAKIIPAFDDPKYWSLAERYNTTKLLLLMFIHNLKDHISSDEVVVNVADPGFVQNGGLDRSTPSFLKIIMVAARRLLARSDKAGAWSYVDAAVVKPESTHGSWMSNWAVHPFPKIMYSRDGKRAADMLWEETIEELDGAGVRAILSSIGK